MPERISDRTLFNFESIFLSCKQNRKSQPTQISLTYKHQILRQGSTRVNHSLENQYANKELGFSLGEFQIRLDYCNVKKTFENGDCKSKNRSLPAIHQSPKRQQALSTAQRTCEQTPLSIAVFQQVFCLHPIPWWKFPIP